jgi:hypothetical protein
MRSGINNVTLNWNSGGSMDFNFSVVAEDGWTTSPSITFRIMQAAPSTDCSWAAVILGPGAFSAYLTSENPVSDRNFSLSSTSAYGLISVQLALAAGATCMPATLSPSFNLGARMVQTTFTFVVTAEDALISDTVTLILTPAPTNYTNWTLNAMSNGVQPSNIVIDSSTAQSLTSVAFPYVHAPIDNTSLVAWMSGANCGTAPNAPAVGTILQPSDSATPASRRSAASWVGVDTHLYLYC